MKHFQLLLLFLIVSFSALTQVQLDVDCLAKDLKTGKKEAGVTVRVYEGSTVVASGVTAASGKVLLKVPTGKSYKIEFSKPGKVTRFVNVNAKNIDVELLQGAAAPIVYAEISLFDETANVDFSYIKNNPITEFYFDGKSPKLAYNTTTSDKMSKEVDKAMAAAENSSGNNEVQFQAKMKEAEALATQKKYVEAAAKFEQALMFKPTDKVAIKRLDDMDKLIKADKISQLDGEAMNAEFDNLVKAAELLKSQKKYEEAIAKYEEALTKKKDQNVEDEIDELMETIKKEKRAKENEANYTAAMTAAEGLLKQKSYQAAKDQYNIALKAKPADPTATKKLADVEVLLNAAKGEQEKKKNYEAAVNAGDELFKAEKWAEAKVKYDEALVLQPASPYVQGQLTAIKTKLDEIEKEKAKQEQISKLLAEGTTAMNADQLEPAKTKFSEVLKLDASNATATEKLKIINEKLEEQKKNAEKEASFAKLVTEGDALAKTAKHAEAIAKYEEAIKLKTDAGVDKKIADSKAEIEKLKNQKELKEKYDLAVKEGEALLTANKLQEAKVKFTEAQTLDDKAQLPKDKLKIIEDKLLAEENNKQKAEKYKAAMDAGEALFGQGKLTEARAEFVKAKEIDKTQTAPDAKIKTIDDQLKADAASKEKADKYAAAMKAGDDFHAAGKLAEAKAEYVKAKGIDGTQTAPDEKIKAIDAEMADQATAKAAKEKADKYAAAMKAGDDFRAAGKYVEAKAEYVKAKGIDGTQTDPDTRIAAVDAEMADQATAKAAKEKADKYAAAMKAGDDFRAAAKYTEAKAEYTKAKGIDATQTAPDEKIKAIDEEMANATAAKEAKEKADKYNAAMKAGNDLQAAGKLTEARAEYVKAKGIDGTQTAPDEKIKAIDAALGDQAAAQEKKKQIDELMSAGGALMAKKEYENAKAKYQQVLVVDAGNAEATKKIEEADAKLNEAKNQAQRDAEFASLKTKGMDEMSKGQLTEAKQTLTQAKNIKADAEIDEKIKEIDAKIASQGVEEAYAGLMKEAADLESANNYDGAIQKYQQASAKKPAEQAPKDKIKALQTLKQNNEALAETDRKYQAAMQKGNEAFKAEDYITAVKFYTEASSIKPNEKEPIEKLDEAKNIDFKKNYEKILNAAQKAADEKNWDKSIDLYNRAIGIKKEDPLPKEKLAEVERLKKAEAENKNAQVETDKNYTAKLAEAEAAAKLKEYDKAIALFTEAKKLKPQETAPDNRIADLNKAKASEENAAKNEQLYQTAMTNGDNAVKAKKYEDAIAAYKNALNVKPQDKKAANMISEVQQIIDDLTNTADMNRKKEEFKALVDQADNFFNSANWSSAKEKYEAALVIFPKDAHASSQLKKAIDKQKGEAEADAKYTKLIADADASFNAGDYIKAKELYTKAAAQKPTDDHPKSKLQSIEDILNPKIVQNGPLPNMGTPSDNSILDAQALLAKADAQRKNKTAVELSEENKAQQNLQVQRSEDKTQSSYGISAGIQEIGKKSDANAPSDDENRLHTVASVVDQSKKVISSVDQEMNYENAETNDITNKMAVEKIENEKDYAVREGVYEKNTGIVKSTDKTLRDDLNAKSTKVYESSLETQKTVNNAVIKVAENDFDDYEARKITEVDVRNAQKTYNTIDDERHVAAIDKSQSIKDEVEKNNELKTSREVEEMKVSSANKEILAVDEKKMNAETFKKDVENTQNTYETSTRLDNERTELSKTDLRRDDNRIAAVETIKKGENELDKLHRNQFNELYVKSITNQGNIATEKKSEDGVAAMRAEVQTKDFGTITQTSKDVTLKTTATNLDDENQRLSTKATVASEDIKISKAATVNAEKPNENKEIMKKTDAANNALDKAAQEKQVQKNYDVRGLIAKIESKEVKFDEAAANSLGSSYPEGVSQESFNENGIDGLPIAVVTRRIVVTKGHGDVYVRKQTLNGITYSKNGEPSTEYVWQKETADGKLVRNY